MSDSINAETMRSWVGNDAETEEERLLRHLEQYCLSYSLTFDGLKAIVDWFIPEQLYSVSSFLHKVCHNERVTHEMVEYLVELHPAAVEMKCDLYIGIDEMEEPFAKDAFPLHMACLNKACPNSVIELLMRRRSGNRVDELTQSCMPNPENWNHCEYDYGNPGLPLHLYLARTENVDADIVKHMITEYPDALLVGCDFATFSLPIHTVMWNPNLGEMFEVIKLLVQAKPKTLEMKDSNKYTPLHIACSNKSVTFEIVKYLIDIYPHAAREIDDKEEMPLNIICSSVSKVPNKTAIEILKLLLTVHPDGLRHGNYDGECPFHDAVTHESLDFVKVILDTDPGLVGQIDGYGRFPLHHACLNGSIETVKYLHGLFPELAMVRNLHRDDGNLPLHYACMSRDPDVLKFIYEQFPEAIELTGQGGLPIHHALHHPRENTTKIIQFLLSHDPDCLSRPTSNGSFPLHVACESYSDRAAGVIEFIFGLYPDGVLLRNQEGKLPADVLREQSYKENDQRHHDKIRFLSKQQSYVAKIKSSDQAITTPDECGRLLLHHALSDDSPMATIELLYKQNPNAIHVADNDGILPLQIACADCRVDVVKFLLELTEDSVNIVDEEGDFLLHYACRRGNVELIKYLLDNGHKCTVSEKNNDGNLPIQIFNSFVWISMGQDETEYTEVFWKLLLAYPETLKNW